MKILMEHVNLGPDRRQWVDKEAFDVAWSQNGWKEVDRQGETTDTEAVAAAPPARPSWELHDEKGNSIDYSEADEAEAKAAAKAATKAEAKAAKENA